MDEKIAVNSLVSVREAKKKKKMLLKETDYIITMVFYV